MQLVQRNKIDTDKWNKKVASSKIENVFLYAWYLDAVSTNWSAIIVGDYQTILPIPFTKKLGVKQFIQAPFTREYDIIGNDFNWSQVIEFLANKFKSLHFRNQHENILAASKTKTRKHQWLDLSGDFTANYSTNAKRILKKTSAYSVEVGSDTKIVLKLFIEHVAHKIDTISNDDLLFLKKLMRFALAENHGELLVVKKLDKIVAAGFFLFDKNRVTYLKGAAVEEDKKAGAMYLLMDQAMKRYAFKFKTFDFGGSDIEGVATFYHKFGAVDRTYFDYTVNDLPFWFKALKKIKR